MSNDVASALSSAADMALLLVPAGGPGGIIAGITSIALKAGAAIAAAGGDPVVEITRMLSSTPGVVAVRNEWDAIIDREFPDVPQPPATHPSPPPSDAPRDPYED